MSKKIIITIISLLVIFAAVLKFKYVDDETCFDLILRGMEMSVEAAG